MGLLGAEDTKELIERFKGLEAPVTIIMVTREHECPSCTQTREILEEVAGLSDKITLTILDFVADADEVARYGIDKVPATIIVGKSDHGIRFYGTPSGYEYSTLLDDLMDVSRGTSTLPDSLKERLAALESPVHIQVFVSPTCPYCAFSVHTAHQFALESEHVTADMVETTEFTDLATKYDVFGVPKIIVNETTEAEGAAPPEAFMDLVEDALTGTQ